MSELTRSRSIAVAAIVTAIYLANAHPGALTAAQPPPSPPPSRRSAATAVDAATAVSWADGCVSNQMTHP